MSSVAFVVSTFAEQFQRDGAGFIYRKNLRGAPIRVTAAERDAFVADFRRGYIVLIAVMTVFVVVAMVLAIALGVLGNGTDPLMVGVGFAVAALLFLPGLGWGIYRIYDAPRRALANRAAEGEPMTRAEARQMVLGSISYRTLAMAGIVGFGIVGLNAMKYDVWHGWGRLWWLPAILLGGLAAVQAVRKWREERR